jgi:lipopolysaccharide export system permease protein
MKILFLTSNRVGDAVLSTGLLAWLVERYSGAAITVACGPYAVDLFRAVPHLERLIILKKQSWNRHWFGLWRECIGTKWDIVVDLRNSIVSRLLFADKRYYGVRRTGVHKVIENAAALNLSPPPAPHIWLDDAVEAEAAKLLPDSVPILALGPAANWTAKQWPIERFAELAQKLTVTYGPLANAYLLVIADTHERRQITPLLQSLPDNHRIELIGRDLLTVAACLKRATLFVGNDSGLMHIAGAMGIKTLGLFGPGYEDIYGPWGPNSAYVRTDRSREDLIKQGHGNLMESLSVEKVYAAATQLLAK